MFESVGLVYGLSLPFIVLILFTFLALPAVFRPSVRAESIGYAAYCYLAQMFGILLMTGGALPALYAVFATQPLSEVTYLGLLLAFGIGGLLFLWHDAQLGRIDHSSKAIPGTLFFITWKFIGLLISVLSILSLILRLMTTASQPENWWVTNLIMLLYGLILSWFTLHRSTHVPTFSTPINAPKKLIAAKSKPKQRAKRA